MPLKIKLAFIVAALLGFAACSQQSVLPDHKAALNSTTTIQELMRSSIDPAADGVWNAVSTSITVAGVEEKQPHSNEEWAVVRQSATALINAAIRLGEEGLPVAVKGTKSENPGIEESPEEVQKLIDANPKGFSQHAQKLRASAEEALAAIDAKNPTALLEAGGRIDEVCEQCHKTFWYPNQFKSKR
jgi:cytochrome c556